ncbi:MAG: hypothetical protein KTR31_21820 [Myxococcales bacterium]|nr:hypothetical protein [Myxococcales bacterium]
MKRLTAIALLVGCGGENVVFAELDAQERTDYMTDTVLPEMQAEFEAFDARFANMSCNTCHQDTTFAIPNPDLPGLDLTNPPTGAGADFMADTVVPRMQELLGDDTLDCLSCHPSL